MVSQNLASFKSRQEYRRNVELEEARKAGLVPAEVDKNGKEINPHIPKYVSDTPWYIKTDEGPSLEHQRKPESNVNGKKKSQYDSGAKVIQALKYREGACTNCGSMKHDAKSCIERPRKVGAKWNDKHIAPDEIVETLGHLTYDEKRDRWDGYNPSSYAHVLKRYELQQEARKKYLKEERIKKLEDQDVHHDDDMRVDEAKVDESKQTDFAKVEKRVRTAGGGSTGTVRNLRIREDTAKYLRNLDVNSAHYDPKSRSMRENPNPDADPNEQFYAGDNVWRNTGQALDFNQMNMHALEAFERGQDVHMQAAPSQAEFLYKNYKKIKERFTTQTNCTVLEKYMAMQPVEENFLRSFYWDRVNELSNTIELGGSLRARKKRFLGASMQKMSLSATTLVCGVRGGKVTDGGTSVVSNLCETVIAQVPLELRLPRLQYISWSLKITC